MNLLISTMQRGRGVWSCGEKLSWSRGTLMTRCCPWLPYHSSAIVDLYCNLHSFLIKWWSLDREKLASKEVTSGPDGISWLEGNLLHNVLIHICVPSLYTANFSLPVLSLTASFPQVSPQSSTYSLLLSLCLQTSSPFFNLSSSLLSSVSLSLALFLSSLTL